jgi:hypothetical protein
MLLISRPVYPVIVHILYSRPNFNFDSATLFLNFVSKLQPETLKLIRCVRLVPTYGATPLDEEAQESEIRQWADCLASLPRELRGLEMILYCLGQSGLLFFSRRGTHPLLVHALRRFASLEELEIFSPEESHLHFDFLFRTTPYFGRYDSSLLADPQPAPVFPNLRKLKICSTIVHDPAYLTAALSAKNLPSLDCLIMRPRLHGHSEESEAFSPETFSRLRQLRVLAWKTYDHDRAEASPAFVLPHRDFTATHLEALSERHRDTLEVLWLDLTRTTIQTKDIWVFLTTMTKLQTLVLWVPAQCFSLFALIAGSDDGFLPSLWSFELGVTCDGQSTLNREAIIPLPLSRFSMRLGELRLRFFNEDGDEETDELESTLAAWLEESLVSIPSLWGTAQRKDLCEFVVGSGDDDCVPQTDFGSNAGGGSRWLHAS